MLAPSGPIVRVTTTLVVIGFMQRVGVVWRGRIHAGMVAVVSMVHRLRLEGVPVMSMGTRVKSPLVALIKRILHH